MFLLKVLKVLHLNIKCFITLLRPTKPQIKKTIKTSSKAALSSEGRLEKLPPPLQQESDDVSAATLQQRYTNQTRQASRSPLKVQRASRDSCLSRRATILHMLD